MSGLFGHLGAPGGDVNRDVVSAMAARLRHRPWQMTETACPDPAAAVGRIGIGVFNRDPQPERSADGAVWLWLSGEFYHQQETRALLAAAGRLAPGGSDAALALAVYTQDGVPGLTKLEGAFVVALWDARSRECVIVNDRFGLYPHFYAHTGGAFTFAPEVKAVLCAPRVPRALDRVTVAQLLRFQQALGDRTWLEEVHVLPPASVVRFRPDDDRLRVDSYWKWDDIGWKASVAFDDAVDECIAVFQRATDAMTQPPGRLGVFLSGGLDGRTILGFIPAAVPATTITFGAAGCRDVVYAARLARIARRPHRWFRLEDGRWVEEHAALHLALTSGLHGWQHSHGISILDGVRSLFDVNLSGYDGGTILGGSLDFYRDGPYRDAPTRADLTQRFYDAFCQRFTWPGLTEAEAHALLSGRGDRELLPLAWDSLQAELRRVTTWPPGRQADFFYNEQVLRRLLQDQVTVQRSAIEVRCPFFDYALIDLLYSLPSDIRTSPSFRRAVLTRRMPRLVLVPYEKDDRLPHSSRLLRGSHDVAQRVKNRINRHVARIFPDRPRLYADYENYLRTDLRGWAEAILFDPRTVARGLFDPAAVGALWQRHLAGAELWTLGKVAPLVSIELALRYFFDGEQGAGLEVRPPAARERPSSSEGTRTA